MLDYDGEHKANNRTYVVRPGCTIHNDLTYMCRKHLFKVYIESKESGLQDISIPGHLKLYQS